MYLSPSAFGEILERELSEMRLCECDSLHSCRELLILARDTRWQSNEIRDPLTYTLRTAKKARANEVRHKHGGYTRASEARQGECFHLHSHSRVVSCSLRKNVQPALDLIDLQLQLYGECKFIIVYQDHLTKFVTLHPLTSKHADEVAHELLDVFLTFGVPAMLQSDNDREFANYVINSLREMCPELHIVHGKLRHSHNQGNIERANPDIENMSFT